MSDKITLPNYSDHNRQMSIFNWSTTCRQHTSFRVNTPLQSDADPQADTTAAAGETPTATLSFAPEDRVRSWPLIPSAPALLLALLPLRDRCRAAALDSDQLRHELQLVHGIAGDNPGGFSVQSEAESLRLRYQQEGEQGRRHRSICIIVRSCSILVRLLLKNYTISAGVEIMGWLFGFGRIRNGELLV